MPTQIPRRHTTQVQIGNITIGSKHPIAVQSMTDTNTENIEDTVNQAIELIKAGSELVRITVNTEKAAAAIPFIKEKLLKKTYHQPLVGDFHYNGHILLTKYPQAAESLDKYRINPGNVGAGKLHNYNFDLIVEQAIKYNKPVRIGVNGGSLDQELLTAMMNANAKTPNPETDREIFVKAVVQSALNSAIQAEKVGLGKDKIIISAKLSVVQEMIYAYELLADKCDYPLHLGLTEAGMGTRGVVASAAALAILLQKGIGDTIRTSITPEKSAPRTKEVEVCQHLLQSMNFRSFRPSITSCPGCGRTSSSFFREMTEKINAHINENMPIWQKKYPGCEKIKIAVMGCIVNGPGESKHADIGISLPGNMENPHAPVYIDGKIKTQLKGNKITQEFIEILEKFLHEKFDNNL
jgi:(E)-4-hydroxy-3-methylbut-2-enyl-diphosphate synthase